MKFKKLIAIVLAVTSMLSVSALAVSAAPSTSANVTVKVDGKVVGRVTTGYRSISCDKSVCVALVDKDYAAMGSEVEVRIRKKTFKGTICKRRFYEAKYKK